MDGSLGALHDSMRCGQSRLRVAATPGTLCAARMPLLVSHQSSRSEPAFSVPLQSGAAADDPPRFVIAA